MGLRCSRLGGARLGVRSLCRLAFFQTASEELAAGFYSSVLDSSDTEGRPQWQGDDVYLRQRGEPEHDDLRSNGGEPADDLSLQ